jgi:two-component system, NarL family, nitrate/nitrite response regulator NarL
VLGRTTGLTVVEAVADADGCLAAARDSAPDATLLDLTTPDSLALIRELGAEVPESRVVALAVPEDEAAVIACAEAGVAAFLTREQSVDDLLETLASVARGETRMSPKLAAMLLRRVTVLAAQRPNREGPRSERARLTRREHEVLRLLDEGLSNKQIARRLCIELPTVKNHVHRILEKLAVRRRTEAVAWLHGRVPERGEAEGIQSF